MTLYKYIIHTKSGGHHATEPQTDLSRLLVEAKRLIAATCPTKKEQAEQNRLVKPVIDGIREHLKEIDFQQRMAEKAAGKHPPPIKPKSAGRSASRRGPREPLPDWLPPYEDLDLDPNIPPSKQYTYVKWYRQKRRLEALQSGNELARRRKK